MNDSVQCPYCGQKIKDLWEYNMNDGDTLIVECDCGKSFQIKCNVNTYYRVNKFHKTKSKKQKPCCPYCLTNLEFPIEKHQIIECPKCRETLMITINQDNFFTIGIF